jgi:hypothetical protein
MLACALSVCACVTLWVRGAIDAICCAPCVSDAACVENAHMLPCT